MAIQYAGGTNVNTTFAGDTKTLIIAGIQSALTTAGWSVISGGGTTNVVMQTATTPQGLAIQVRLKDNGGGCAQISIMNTSGSIVGGSSTTAGGNLNAIASRTYRIIANKYQFFVMVPAVYSTNRCFVGAGVPYIPSPNAVPANAGWMTSDSSQDSNGANFGWRTTLYQAQGSFPNTQLIWGSSMFECANNFTNNNTVGSFLQFFIGTMASLTYTGGSSTSGQPTLYRWANGDVISSDTLLSWGLTGFTDEPMLRCQLWDSLIIHDSFAGDTTTSFDSHNWFCVTNANVGSMGATPRSSLFIVTP